MAVPSLNRVLNVKVHDGIVRNDPKQAYQSVALALRCAETIRRRSNFYGAGCRIGTSDNGLQRSDGMPSTLPPPEEEFRFLDRLLAEYDDGSISAMS